jgi:membrane protease YdiL (CAAX protease family)
VAALLLLRLTASPAYAPNLFPAGVAFGVIAGFCEEFGWSRFAYPRMRSRLGAVRGAVILGLLWGLWHLPVVDSLGVATPHGRAWPFFFLAFALMVTALRVLIAQVYFQLRKLAAGSADACELDRLPRRIWGEPRYLDPGGHLVRHLCSVARVGGVRSRT